MPGYIGSPPTCRPECVVNSDCLQKASCLNQKCKDPCPGTCGIGATCTVVNHQPICRCPPRYTGDPFVRCQEIGNINRLKPNVTKLIILKFVFSGTCSAKGTS